MERHEIRGLPIFAWPRALGADEIAALERIAPWGTLPQGVVQHPAARELAAIVEPRMVGAPPIIGWTPCVSITNANIPCGWHVDKDEGCGADWKVIVYLNDVAGTLFARPPPLAPLEIPAGAGTIVLWDIRLVHCSAYHSPKRYKRAVGLRPIIAALR